MRLLACLGLMITLSMATTAEARLFWQTYGSTVTTADGCGCAWNQNQDYFVPRHGSSCRYGLNSPCKSSRSTSPACRWSHPIHSGYCGIYGPCHYRRRNRVYAAHCGCTPLQPYGGCCSGGMSGSCGAGAYAFYGEPMALLPNVEPSQMDILGSIPLEGSELLTRTDFSQLGNSPAGQLLLPPSLLPQTQDPMRALRSLGLPGLSQPRP